MACFWWSDGVDEQLESALLEKAHLQRQLDNVDSRLMEQVRESYQRQGDLEVKLLKSKKDLQLLTAQFTDLQTEMQNQTLEHDAIQDELRKKLSKAEAICKQHAIQQGRHQAGMELIRIQGMEEPHERSKAYKKLQKEIGAGLSRHYLVNIPALNE
eukprot:s6046_g4.t1